MSEIEKMLHELQEANMGRMMNIAIGGKKSKENAEKFRKQMIEICRDIIGSLETEKL